MKFPRSYDSPLLHRPTSADVALDPVLPYPDGWFALAFSAELGPSAVLTRRLQGEDVVLYRTADGTVQAVRPYCPHLGAHLGLGRLDGDDLVCPFHNFAFGPDGSCVRTGYGTPPPRISLTTLPVCEVNDAVFVWRHHDGRLPDWEIPAWHRLGHLPPRYDSWEMAGHAQEVIENSVDLGHFSALHGWVRASWGDPLTFDRETFHLSMRVRESLPLLGETDVDVQVDGYGVSCLHADVHTPRIGARMCSMVMATMVAPNRFQLRQSSRLLLADPKGLPKPLARWTARALTRVLAGPMFKWSCDFTAADFPVWDTKKYLSPPGLAQGDGPIGPFRHWARQFYPAAPNGRPSPAPPPGRVVPARGRRD